MIHQTWSKWQGVATSDVLTIDTRKTSLICILLLASRDVNFDKRMICFLIDLL